MAQKNKVQAKTRAAAKSPAAAGKMGKKGGKKMTARKPAPDRGASGKARASTAPHAKAKAAAPKKPAAAVRPPLVAAKAKPAPVVAAAKAQVRPVPSGALVRGAAPARVMPASVGKSGQPRITSPVSPATPKAIAERTAAARQLLAARKKPVSQRHGFKTNEYIVYPAHGVGRIVGIEEQEIAGMALELFVITFEKEKLTLRVPTGKLQSVGMRKLSEEGTVRKAMETLKGRARIKRTMWSRRAQEYVAKINSGDLVSIAEVVRDLYRSEAQPEQSYSERQLYEDALDRMAREIAAVEKLDERGAMQRITEVLAKSARGRRMAEDGADAAEVKAA
jgi:CarD family transcriptional regulator